MQLGKSVQQHREPSLVQFSQDNKYAPSVGAPHGAPLAGGPTYMGVGGHEGGWVPAEGAPRWGGAPAEGHGGRRGGGGIPRMVSLINN